MSANLSINPSPKPAVLLPAELYLRIITEALELPFEFDVELFRLARPKRFAERTLRARLVSSRHLIRVCRQWHYFVLPLFYETVWVSKMSQVKALIHRFQTPRESYIVSDNAASTSSPSPLIASYVKRLVFTPSMRANINDHHPILQLAVHCSSNLISLHVLSMIRHQNKTYPDSHNARSEQFISDLASLRNLEVLNTSVIWPYPSLPPVWNAIDGMKRLEVLRIDGLTWPHEYLAKLVHTNLRKLSIAAPFSSPQDLHIPSLEEIFFLGSRFDPAECPKFSGNIERLTLYTGSEWSLAGLLSSDWLSLHFPRIRRLDILIPDWDDMGYVQSPLRVTLPEGLTHVGLSIGGKVQGTNRDYLALKDFCAAVASSATQIEAVQMLSRQTCVDLTRRHPVVLDGIVNALHTKRLRLLDSDGKPFPAKRLEGDQV